MDTQLANTRAAKFAAHTAQQRKQSAQTEYEDACDALLALLTTPGVERSFDVIVVARAAARAARENYERAILSARDADRRVAEAEVA